MITYGATHDRLRELGYAPCSATRPDAPHSFRLSEDAAAIKCVSPRDSVARNVAAIVVTAMRKKPILAVLAKRALAAGPCRTSAAGDLTFPLRIDEYSPMLTRHSETIDGEMEPAIVLDTWQRTDSRIPHVSAIIRLDGTWTNGDLLSTSRAELPCLDNQAIEALFADLRGALPAAPVRDYYVPPENRPPRAPTEREKFESRFVAPRCKRDLLGNATMMRLYSEAVARGECEELPDNLPEEIT